MFNLEEDSEILLPASFSNLMTIFCGFAAAYYGHESFSIILAKMSVLILKPNPHSMNIACVSLQKTYIGFICDT